MIQQEILVAINCLTYNHEPYIRQCLEGFVTQKTKFRFVAIVHDDASTDITAKIVREYADKYPDIIKPIFETENQYSKKDGSLDKIINQAINETNCKYIAVCEGDDYWIDPFKLQKQIDFLENNPEYTLCFHNAKVIFENKEIEYHHRSRYGELFSNVECKDYSGIEVYENWLVPTASVVFRREILNSEIYQNAVKCGKFRYGDILIFLSCAHYGKIRGLKDTMSVYRRLQTGVVIKDEKQDNTEALIEHHTQIPIVFGKEYKKSSIRKKTYVYLSAWIRHKRFLYIVKAFKTDPKEFCSRLFKVVRRRIISVWNKSYNTNVA